MPDLIKKFEKAAREISSGEKDIRERVYGAYSGYLSDIDSNDLPLGIQIFYESVKLRLTSTLPPGKICADEASRIADDILYMADMIRIHNRQ